MKSHISLSKKESLSQVCQIFEMKNVIVIFSFSTKQVINVLNDLILNLLIIYEFLVCI